MKDYKQLTILMPAEVVDLVRASAKAQGKTQREWLTAAILAAVQGTMKTRFGQRNMALARANPRDALQQQLAHIELPEDP